MMTLKYEKITKENIVLAARIQYEIFPNSSAYIKYLKDIETTSELPINFLIFLEEVPIGVVGLYELKRYKDTIWLSWFGILKQYRKKGIGKQILNDMIKKSREYNKKYLRLFTYEVWNSEAQALYKNVMEIEEFYTNRKDNQFDIKEGKCKIFSISLSDEKVDYWNNKFIDIGADDIIHEESINLMKERGILEEKMISKQILEFYKKTSLYTDLGLYTQFARNLSNDINKLCVLQRMQIIHPVAFKDIKVREKESCFWGNMTKVEKSRLNYEDDLFPTAISMLSELLRKNKDYSCNREAKDKIHITCRGQAILLASILKAKAISARVRSGFAPYIKNDGIAYDHWITEYYNDAKNMWILVDADMHCPDYKINFDLNNVPRENFIFGAQAYLDIRNKKIREQEILYASDPPTLGLKASIRALFYDFHCLMNNEITFLHLPRYIQEKDFELSEEEYLELDKLANLLLEPDKNFEKILDIWNTKEKFKIMSGALND